MRRGEKESVTERSTEGGHDEESGEYTEDEDEYSEQDGEESPAGEDERRRSNQPRLMVTNEGLLDPSVLVRTEGFMHKQGGAVNARGGFKNWKRRWFVLAPVEFLDTEGFELQYFESPGGLLKGRVGLSEVEIIAEPEGAPAKKGKFDFQVLLQNGATLRLSCDEEREKYEWIDTLNMVSAYLRKVLSKSAMTLDGYDPMQDDEAENFSIGEELGQNAQAFGPGLFGSEAGTPAQFIIQMHDLLGQKVTRGGMPITATLHDLLPSTPASQALGRGGGGENGGGSGRTQFGDCLYYLRVHDNKDGTYSAHYVLGTVGRYSLSVRLNDEHHVFGSPFEVEILPSRTVAALCVAIGHPAGAAGAAGGVADRRSSAASSGDASGYGSGGYGSAYSAGSASIGASQYSDVRSSTNMLISIPARSIQTFTILARDGFGNRKLRGGDPFEVGVMGPAQLRSLTDNGDGSYLCEIEAQSPSQVQYVSSASLLLMVTLHGKHISGSPFKPVIVDASSPAGSFAGLSNGYGSGMGSPGDGGSLSQLSNAPPPYFTSPVIAAAGNSSDSTLMPPSSYPSSSSSPEHSSAVDSASLPYSSEQQRTSEPVSEVPVRKSLHGAPSLSASTNSAPPGSGGSVVSASTAASTSSAPLSRLERARQRAVHAKAVIENHGHLPPASALPAPLTSAATANGYRNSSSQQQVPGSLATTSTPISRTPFSSPPPAAAAAANIPPSMTSMNLHIVSGAGGVGVGSGNRLQQLAARNQRTLNNLRDQQKQQQQQQAQAQQVKELEQVKREQHQQEAEQWELPAEEQEQFAPLSSSEAQAQAQAQLVRVSQQEAAQVGAALRMGLGGGSGSSAPGNATMQERNIWDHTHGALTGNREVLALLTEGSALSVLRALFSLFAERLEGVSVVKLTTSSARGLYRLLELYEVVPAWGISKVEAKVLYALVLYAQRNLKSAASVAGGGIGLDFVSFLKFLVMMAHHALSKTNAFSSLYDTMEAKVHVMLYKWGLADSLRLQTARIALSGAP